MRRFFPLLIAIAVTAAAGWLDAQGGSTLTFGGAPNTGVQLQRSTDGGKTWSPMPLGTTTNAGALTLSPSQVNLLSGKGDRHQRAARGSMPERQHDQSVPRRTG